MINLPPPTQPGVGGPEVKYEAVLVCLGPGASSTREEGGEAVPVKAGSEHRSWDRREAGTDWTGEELHGGEDWAGRGAGQVERGAAAHQDQGIL